MVIGKGRGEVCQSCLGSLGILIAGCSILVLTVLWLCRLPKKDNPRRGLWLANCQRLDPSGQGLWDPASEYIYFCSKHFEENCFELVGIRWVLLPANARMGCEASEQWVKRGSSMPW